MLIRYATLALLISMLGTPPGMGAASTEIDLLRQDYRFDRVDLAATASQLRCMEGRPRGRN